MKLSPRVLFLHKERYIAFSSFSAPTAHHEKRGLTLNAPKNVLRYRVGKYHNIFENIKIIKKYHDIFEIFQKMTISNKLCNSRCNTLMQYLMTISYQSFVPHVKT